jgi:phosphomannomutase/phosphoglucomutase
MNQNIFREYDIRGIVGPDLTDETVAILGKAIGTFFQKNGAKRIAVGFDARVSSPRFRDLLVEGFNQTGCDAILIGKVPTPVLYHTAYTKAVDGGVMITGSHNPPDHNGFKICLGKQTLFGSQIQEIKEIAVSGEFASGSGSIETLEVLADYERDIISKINLGERRLKVVVDGGNGMGGVTGVPVYESLGCELVKLFTEPDSNFPNHHPDPTSSKIFRTRFKRSKKPARIWQSLLTATATASAS